MYNSYLLEAAWFLCHVRIQRCLRAAGRQNRRGGVPAARERLGELVEMEHRLRPYRDFIMHIESISDDQVAFAPGAGSEHSPAVTQATVNRFMADYRRGVRRFLRAGGRKAIPPDIDAFLGRVISERPALLKQEKAIRVFEYIDELDEEGGVECTEAHEHNHGIIAWTFECAAHSSLENLRTLFLRMDDLLDVGPATGAEEARQRIRAKLSEFAALTDRQRIRRGPCHQG